MPKKKVSFILSLLALLMIFQSGIAEAESYGGLKEKMEQRTADPTQFRSLKYFYTTCRDMSAFTHLESDGKLDHSYNRTLYMCSTYLVASVDWFLFMLRENRGIKFFDCYLTKSKLDKLSYADISTLFFSYLNLNKNLLDLPGADTPFIFSQAVLTEYPIPKQCENKAKEKY